MDAEYIVKNSLEPDDTRVLSPEEERRLYVMSWTTQLLAIGRSSPPTIYEIFELMHYLDHWLATGAIPQAPPPKLTVVK